MLILTKEQRDVFLKIKESIQDELSKNNVDFIPIEVKGDLWILPDEVLADERFSKLKNELEKVGEFDKYQKREFDKSELKESDISTKK